MAKMLVRVGGVAELARTDLEIRPTGNAVFWNRWPRVVVLRVGPVEDGKDVEGVEDAGVPVDGVTGVADAASVEGYGR